MLSYDVIQTQIDRLQANPKFRDLAASIPLVRRIGRRRARQLYDLCAGFVYSQILLACVRFDLFERLFRQPMTAAALAPDIGLTEDAAERLLRAGRAVQLFRRRSGHRYGLGRLGVAMIGNQGVREMIEHHPMLYADLADPVALLKGQAETRMAQYWAYATTTAPADVSSEAVTPYTALMSASQPMITAEILSAYPLRKHRCLLDVAGGDGRFIAGVAKHVPGLKLMLFDLPAVAEQARQRFEREGIADRAQSFGGDIYSNELPTGADIISLVRVVHDHNDSGVAKILAAAYRALPPDGTLLVAEVMSDTPGAEPMGDAYFGFYLLAMRSGRPRSPKEIKALLAAAGFERSKLLATKIPMLTRVMIARKPVASG